MLGFCLATMINGAPTSGPRDCCCSSTTAFANRGYCDNASNGGFLCTTGRAGPTANVCNLDEVAFDYFNDEPQGYPECPSAISCSQYCATVPEGDARNGCISCCLHCCPNSGD